MVLPVQIPPVAVLSMNYDENLNAPWLSNSDASSPYILFKSIWNGQRPRSEISMGLKWLNKGFK